MTTPSPPSAPAPAPPVTPVAPPPQTPALAPPPVTPTPPPVTPTPTPPVTPTPSPLPPTPPPQPPTPPPQPPTPTPTPTPEPPSPQPPVSPPPPPPQPRPTPTPAPVTPSPPPPRPVTPSPPPPANVPVPSPPPPAVNPPPPDVPTSPPPRNDVPTSPPPPDVPTSPPPPNDVPASPAPPPSHLSLSPPPPPQSAEAPSTSASSPKSNSGTVVGVGVAVAAVVVLGLAAGLICFFVARRRRHRRRPPPAPGFPADFYDPWRPVTPPQQSHALSTTPSSTPPLMHSWESSAGPSESPLPPFKVSGGTFAYDELAAAADGFSDANLLGQGGFGHVYKGTVRGQEVAIKKLRAGSGQGDREFRAEVEIISRVHHKNLVSLVGYCIHGEQRLLVYEYVPNKTLEFHLHVWSQGSGRPTLDWPRRWKIAVGSAKGLAYLHEDCHPKIIHRDIKAANILLDYNYEPKVADFGLAKYQAAEATSVSTRVMGTFGYLAPEYAATGKVNDRSDVFSFGVMLLELITGRKPIMTSSAYEPETLVSWARPLLTKAVEEENYEELIDPRLETNYDAYDMARLIACAAAAVRQTARSRPRMTQIVRYLEGELSVEDLNAGVAPGQSAMQRTSGGGTTDQIRRLRRMAFGAGTGTGTITEYTSSEFSEPTSEYGLNPSSEYTSSAAETGEIVTEAQTTGTGRRAAEGGGGEASTERMSRRTTASRQAGRAGRG